MCGNACRVFGEAWRKVKGMKAPVWGGLALLAAVGVGGMFILSLIIIFGQVVYLPNLGAMVQHDPLFFLKDPAAFPAGLIVLLLIYHLGQALFEMFLLLPMRMGIFLIPLRHNVEKPVSALYVFKFLTWKYIWRFAVLEALIVLILGIPMGIAMALMCYAKLFVVYTAVKVILYLIGIALYLIALYLMVSYVFAYLLIVDRDMTPWAAMELSRKTITKRWFCVFGTLLWMLFITFIGALLFIVGLIWAIPYTQNVLVILYRDMLGIEGKDPVTAAESIQS